MRLLPLPLPEEEQRIKQLLSDHVEREGRVGCNRRCTETILDEYLRDVPRKEQLPSKDVGLQFSAFSYSIVFNSLQTNRSRVSATRCIYISNIADARTAVYDSVTDLMSD